MGNPTRLAAAIIVGIAGGATAAPHLPADAQDAPQPFFQRQPDGPTPDAPAAVPPRTGEGEAPDVPSGPAPAPQTRAETLDRLFGRLAQAADAGEAQGIAGSIERIWMRSGSDTTDLLMSRAVTAIDGNRHDVAYALLDQIITLRPAWAEAWNKRATLRFLDDDDAGAMEDISHVLALEPRHFGALSGMGFILERHGENGAALKAFQHALEVFPGDDGVRKTVDKLTPLVEGADL